MKFTATRQGNIAVVTTSGRLSSAVAESFQDQLMAVLDGNPAALVVDFSELTFITSSGLRALIIAAKRGRKDGYLVHICAMTESIHEVFAVSGLLRIFLVHASLDEGLAAAGATEAAASPA